LSPQILEETFIVREALEVYGSPSAPRTVAVDRFAVTSKRPSRMAMGVWRSADEDFHVIIARASGNPMLLRLISEDFYQLVRFYRSQLVHVRGRGARTVAEHRRILEAIEDHDAELAELHMRRHIAAARADLSMALQKQHESATMNMLWRRLALLRQRADRCRRLCATRRAPNQLALDTGARLSDRYIGVRAGSPGISSMHQTIGPIVARYCRAERARMCQARISYWIPCKRHFHWAR